MYDEVISLIRRRGAIGIKRYSPWETLLRVAILRNTFQVVCVE